MHILPVDSEIFLPILLRGKARMLAEGRDEMAVRAEIEIVAYVNRGIIAVFEHILRRLYPAGHDEVRDSDPHLLPEQL